MKIIRRVVIAILLLGIAWNVMAEPGPPIPKPPFTIEKASKLTLDHFLANNQDSKHIKNKDYFVISAKYKFFGDIYKSIDGWTADGLNNKKYLEKIKDRWAWEIQIAHSLYTDITITYKVANNGDISLISETL